MADDPSAANRRSARTRRKNPMYEDYFVGTGGNLYNLPKSLITRQANSNYVTAFASATTQTAPTTTTSRRSLRTTTTTAYTDFDAPATENGSFAEPLPPPPLASVQQHDSHAQTGATGQIVEVAAKTNAMAAVPFQVGSIKATAARNRASKGGITANSLKRPREYSRPRSRSPVRQHSAAKNIRTNERAATSKAGVNDVHDPLTASMSDIDLTQFHAARAKIALASEQPPPVRFILAPPREVATPSTVQFNRDVSAPVELPASNSVSTPTNLNSASVEPLINSSPLAAMPTAVIPQPETADDATSTVQPSFTAVKALIKNNKRVAVQPSPLPAVTTNTTSINDASEAIRAPVIKSSENLLCVLQPPSKFAAPAPTAVIQSVPSPTIPDNSAVTAPLSQSTVEVLPQAHATTTQISSNSDVAQKPEQPTNVPTTTAASAVLPSTTAISHQVASPTAAVDLKPEPNAVLPTAVNSPLQQQIKSPVPVIQLKTASLSSTSHTDPVTSASEVASAAPAPIVRQGPLTSKGPPPREKRQLLNDDTDDDNSNGSATILASQQQSNNVLRPQKLHAPSVIKQRPAVKIEPTNVITTHDPETFTMPPSLTIEQQHDKIWERYNQVLVQEAMQDYGQNNTGNATGPNKPRLTHALPEQMESPANISRWSIERVLEYAKIRGYAGDELELISCERLDGSAMLLLSKPDVFRLAKLKNYRVSAAMRVWEFGQHLTTAFVHSRQQMNLLAPLWQL